LLFKSIHTEVSIIRIILFSWLLSLSANFCFAQSNQKTRDLQDISARYIYEGKLDSAKFVLRDIVNFAKNNQDTLTEIKCLSTLAEVYQIEDSLTKAYSIILHSKEAENYFETEMQFEFADIYQYLGAIMMGSGELDQAIYFLKKSVKIRKSLSAENDTLLGYAFNKLGTCFWYKQLHDSSLYFYQKALEVCLNKTNPENAESASYNQNVGFAFLNNGIYDEAEKFLLRSLELKQKLLNKNDPRLARIYLNLGYFYFRISLTNKALNYYQQAEQIYLNNKSSSRTELAQLYWNIGNYYIILGDFSKSQIYLNKALILYKENKGAHKQNLIKINADIGYSYFLSGNYEDAIKNYLISLSSKDEITLIRSYRNLARSYEYLSEIETSESYYKKSIEKAKQLQGEKSENLMLNYSYYADLLYNTQRKEEAYSYYKKAYNICKELYKGKSRELSLILFSLGKYYLTEEKYMNSLSYFQQALIAAVPDYSDTSYHSNPNINQISTDNHIYNILRNKALALHGTYSENPDNIKLKKSIETYELALEVSKNLIRAYSSESSQLEFLHNVRTTWNLLLKTMFQLANSSGDLNNIKKVFYFAEQSKANLLLGAIKDIDARSYGNIPHTLIEEADYLKKDLSYYKKMAFDELLKSKPDESKMTMINNGIFRLKTRYDSLVASFEKDYPSYYSLKYDDKIVSVEEVQNELNQNQFIIEYALTDTLLLAFIIGQDHYDVKAQHIDDSFFESIIRFRQILRHEGMVNYDSTDYANFIGSGYQLYSTLLLPFEDLINNKEVIIIPDGEIGYLSFDMLITKIPEQSAINYRILPYALNKHIFSYSSSATIHFHDFGDKKIKHTSTLLAFAPHYKDFDPSEPEVNQSRNARKTLAPIPGVEDEVNNIIDICSGEMYLNDLATETVFKQLSEQYHILHLAMHTIIDDMNPLYSFLVFAKDDKDTLNDGYLNTYELFNMNFSGELAVLSACNTGTGKLEQGEGIMSLARGFIYSGIPSIVMTLWTVEDQPSANLITSFYKNIADGIPKAVAMNKAKRDFLKQAGPLEAHPYFWAGYVNIGDISPLSINARNPMVNYVWGFLIILVLVVFFVIRRRKHQNS